MKLKFIIYCLSPLLFIVFVASTLIDPNNPPSGRTGAPGETTCAASGCHTGGAFTGTVSIAGVPDSLAADTIYTITLTNESNASRAGFQLTCLDGSNAKCGTLTAGQGCSTASAGGRQYVRQSSPRNLTNGKASWSFTWKAPATIQGDTAHFYFVSLAANGNGEKTGDNPLMGHTKVVIPTVVISSDHEVMGNSVVKIYPMPANDFLNVDLYGKKGLITLLDLQGRKILEKEVTGQLKVDIGTLENGVYFAKIDMNGQAVSRLVIIN